MKYTLFSVDDSREQYKPFIHEAFAEMQQVEGLSVDGRIPEQLARAQSRHPYEVNFPEAKLGHLGIWYGVLNALDEAPIITVEDDAMVGDPHLFRQRLSERLELLPDDADFFSLFIPRDQDRSFVPARHAVNYAISRSYVVYGGVSMYYTERGAERIRELLRRDGITDQYDNTLYRYAREGELNGYSSRPNIPDLIFISGEESSIVQETQYVKEQHG